MQFQTLPPLRQTAERSLAVTAQSLVQVRTFLNEGLEARPGPAVGINFVEQQLIPAHWSGIRAGLLLARSEVPGLTGKSGRAKAEGAAIAKAKVVAAIPRILVFIVVVRLFPNDREVVLSRRTPGVPETLELIDVLWNGGSYRGE